MKVTTFNIRNVRAVDRPSWWIRRRARLAQAVRSIDTDVWGMQEAYRSQVDWLQREALSAGEWELSVVGRNRHGGGEGVPVWCRTERLTVTASATLWYGPSPSTPGSRLDGAARPRIATLVDAVTVDGTAILIVNTHLDEKSSDRRRVSVGQLVEWLSDRSDGRPVIVMGDFNCSVDAVEMQPLVDHGLVAVLSSGDGPTSNNFGRSPGDQIDHILVSREWSVVSAHIHRDAGHASDHYPVSAELSLD